MSDVSSFISDLKSVSQQNTVKITVPSINKVVEFKSLTVKQQKDALKASLSGLRKIAKKKLTLQFRTEFIL